MFELVKKLLQEKHKLFYLHDGITLCTVPDPKAGVDFAASLLTELCDRRTAVYLSGGRTPKELYLSLTKEEQFAPGAVGMIDERFGEKFHPTSNEKMIAETGLLRYFTFRTVGFYPMLPTTSSVRADTVADAYDEQLRALYAQFQKQVGLLGIGSDGHTAGIAGNRKDFHNPLFDADKTHVFVSHFNDTAGPFHERITMTFLALSLLDVLIVLVFGEDKKEALKQVFREGSEEEIPARFYKRPAIAKKTLFITDQSI